MPIYEYECGICGFDFERKQGFDEEPVAMCPRCEGKARRVIHSVPIIFKGGGFYITDSRKGGGKESGESEPGLSGKSQEKEKETI